MNLPKKWFEQNLPHDNPEVGVGLQTPTNEELLRHAEANPIPQRWFDETPQTPPKEKGQ